MSSSSFPYRFRPRRNARRANYGRAVRRPRFETFEDRRMLSFTPAVTYDAGTSGTWDVVTADINNDGHLDLLTPSYFTNQVSLLLGDGNGGFGQAKLFNVGDFPYSVAVGD